MSDVKYTPQQEQAINKQGRTIVSASAGSGKTFVMIEKIISLFDKGVMPDEILAVTFTKKAAEQMRDKMRKAVIKKINSSSDPKTISHFKSVLSKIPMAEVDTIHAFCSHLLRIYFYSVDIDASFDIMAGDDSDAMTLQSNALNKLFDYHYEQADSDFLSLMDVFWAKKSDESLKEIILSSYAKIRTFENYDDILENIDSLFTKEGFESVCEEYKRIINHEIAGYIAQFEELRDMLSDDKSELFIPDDEIRERYVAYANKMIADADTDMRADLFIMLADRAERKTPRIPSVKKSDPEWVREKYDMFSKMRPQKVEVTLLDKQTEFENFIGGGKVSSLLCKLLREFDVLYTAEKKKAAKLDYNDLEHIALKLLSDESVCQALHERYKYVFVDEYQDVNPVQEKIISCVSGENVFLVGDIKQSIYGFRGSKSIFFKNKFDEYRKSGDALFLSSNFRSAENVVNSVNAVFSKLMTDYSCSIDYKNESMMLYGGRYDGNPGQTKVTCWCDAEPEKEIKEVDKVYSVISAAIKNTGEVSTHDSVVCDIVSREIGNDYYDCDEGEFKKIKPQDICILMRKKGEKMSSLVSALEERGYDCVSPAKVNICEFSEIKTLIGILEHIKNERKDVPLAISMVSKLGGFDEEELAKIRLSYKKEDRFYTCVKRYSQEKNDLLADKIDKFYQRVARLRVASCVSSCADVLTSIITENGMGEYFLSRPGGRARLERVNAFIEESRMGREYSVDSFLKKLRATDYKIEYAQGGSDNAIKIMTMHASKGLEFPVVILANLSSKNSGGNERLIFDEKYAFDTQCFDPESMVKKDTLLRKLIRARLAQEEQKNEYNLFYVAMTRAKYSLHMVTENLNDNFIAQNAFKGGTYADFIDINDFTVEYPETSAYQKQIDIVAPEPDETLKKRIGEVYEIKYPFESSTTLATKSSATELLSAHSEGEYYKVNELYRGESGAEKGTAYHAFLQFADFEKKSGAEIEEEISAFIREGKLTKEQAELLSSEKLEKILSMSAFSSLDGKIYREREFLAGIEADRFLDTQAEDEILVQGAIDLLVINGERAHIIDYKYVTLEDDELVRKYAPQLKLYKMAVSKICKIKEENIRTTILNILAEKQFEIE